MSEGCQHLSDAQPPSGGRRRSFAHLSAPAFGTLSQALASAGNFLTLVVAARAGPTEKFGDVALAMAVYTIMIGTSRALLGDPLMIRHQGDSEERRHRTAMTAGLVLGAIAGLGMLVVSIVVASAGDLLDRPLFWLAVCAPLLVWLDMERYQRFALGEPAKAAVLDGAWTGSLIIALVLNRGGGAVSMWAVWCVTGAAVGLVDLVACRGPGDVRRAAAWGRRHFDLGGRLLVETVATVITANVALILFALVERSSQDVAAVRGAVTLFGPLTVVYLGLYASLVGHAQRSRAAQLRLAAVTTSAMVAAALVLTLLLVWIPDSIGVMLLGDTWASAREVVGIIGLSMVASVASTGALLGLRALGAAQQSMRVRLLFAAPGMVLPVLFGAAWGAAGFSTGTLIVVSATTAVTWWAYSRVLPPEEWASRATPD